jgi:DNA invertase Pin-like site-specific DNA recombinase
MKAALYAWVSTSNHGQDVNLQSRELREYCQRRGLEITGEYTDTAIGAKDSRPELKRLMAYAHKRRFDRLARSVSHLLRALEAFNALGIAFVSLTEQMDTTTPTGKMVFTVLGAVAELECSLIAERVRDGLRNARAKRKTLGRPHITVDADAISRLRSQGRSVREIAGELGYSRSLVHKTLANRKSGRVTKSAD